MPAAGAAHQKGLGRLVSGDILVVECTDPLAGVDIPNLLNQTGDMLEDTLKDKRLLTFRSGKKSRPYSIFSPALRITGFQRNASCATKA